MTAVVILIICSIFIFILIGASIIVSKYSKVTPEEINAAKRFIDVNLDISDQISYFMERYKMTPTTFCKKLNINNKTFNKWLSGTHDFKISELTKIEAVFNDDLIKTTLINRKQNIT